MRVNRVDRFVEEKQVDEDPTQTNHAKERKEVKSCFFFEGTTKVGTPRGEVGETNTPLAGDVKAEERADVGVAWLERRWNTHT